MNVQAVHAKMQAHAMMVPMAILVPVQPVMLEIIVKQVRTFEVFDLSPLIPIACVIYNMMYKVYYNAMQCNVM